MAKKAKKKAKKKVAKAAKKKTVRKAATRGRSAARPAKKKTARKAAKKKARRTVMHSSKGKKLYAVRSKSGQFKDIQQYSRAHAADLRRKSADETAAAAPADAAPTAVSSAEMGSDNGEMD